MSNKKRRERLFKEQRGKCYWCGVECIPPPPNGKPHGKNRRWATLDHLDSRLSRFRGAYSNQERTVMACFECNQKRSIAENKYGAAFQMPDKTFGGLPDWLRPYVEAA